jgi:hypothetical protein
VSCPGTFGVPDVAAVVFVTSADMTEDESAVEYRPAGVPIMNLRPTVNCPLHASKSKSEIPPEAIAPYQSTRSLRAMIRD